MIPQEGTQTQVSNNTKLHQLISQLNQQNEILTNCWHKARREIEDYKKQNCELHSKIEELQQEIHELRSHLNPAPEAEVA
jgi:uncharacterized coiled-coil DUF342 family protein